MHIFISFLFILIIAGSLSLTPAQAILFGRDFEELLYPNDECAVRRIYIASGYPSDGKIICPTGISKPSWNERDE